MNITALSVGFLVASIVAGNNQLFLLQGSLFLIGFGLFIKSLTSRHSS